MRRTNIYLDEEQTASLDRLAAQEGVSLAQLIRRLIDRTLNSAETSRSADLAAIENSFGAASDVESLSRRPGDRDRHLGRTWRRAR
jgi:hypothetical protein